MSDTDIQRYRAAEGRLWEYFGIAPKEHFLKLTRQRVRVRIQEVGEGDPVLFVHGSPNAGTVWAPIPGT